MLTRGCTAWASTRPATCGERYGPLPCACSGPALTKGLALVSFLVMFIGAGQLMAEGAPGSVGERDFWVSLPAFVTSELKSAFQIGFLIFIPFLIIDMIVASVLMSLGMMMLSPVLIALPFKLMLFVLADGWNLLLGSLAASFAT